MVERLLDALGVGARFEHAHEPFMLRGQTARIVARDGRRFGLLGQVDPDVADGRGLPRQDPVFVAELDLDAISSAETKTTDAIATLPRYPFVLRDLSVIVADTLPAEIIRGTIQTAATRAPAPLAGVTFFDRYQGKGIPDGSVSVSVRLTLQAPDRTLTDAEVQETVDGILVALARDHGAVQR
jgi:phenylalanyl-tRNA synthetase beta chain